MAKNTNSLTHLLMVIGIVFTLRAEAETDSVIQPEKYFEPTISIQSRFESAGDTVTIPVELGTPLASISGFQFRLNPTNRILDFIQVEPGDSIAEDTTWQVFGNVQSDGFLQVVGVNRTKSSRENLLNVNVALGIEPPDSKLPNRFALMQNYPNPFNLAMTIGFAVRRKIVLLK